MFKIQDKSTTEVAMPNRSTRRGMVATDRLQPGREKKAIQKRKQIEDASKRRESIRKKQEATHQRAVERKIKAKKQ